MKQIIPVLLLVFSLAAFSQGTNEPPHLFQQKLTMPLNGQVALKVPKTPSPVRVEVSISNIIIATDLHPMQPVPPITVSRLVAIDGRMAGLNFGDGYSFTDEQRVQAFIETNDRGDIILRVVGFPQTGVVALKPFDVYVNIWY